MKNFIDEINTKSLYLDDQTKHHSKITIKWLQMLNFDMFPKWSNLYTGAALIVGWLYNLFFLFDLRFFTWEYFIKGFAGFAFAIGTAVVVRVTNIFIDAKIKPKITNYGKRKRHKAGSRRTGDTDDSND